MFDNGLLKYYKQKVCKDGFLDVSDINLSSVNELNWRTARLGLPEGIFYNKFMDSGDLYGKKGIDSEVLLSQIYNKLGIKSAIYLPVTINGEQAVLSNDIVGSHPSQIMLPKDFIERYFSENTQVPPIDLFSEKTLEEGSLSFFSKKAIEQQVKMRMLDTASYVRDRHPENFYYITNKDSAILDIACIDFEDSAYSIDKSEEGEYLFNDLIEDSQTREELLAFYRTSPEVAQYVDKSKLAEDIGSINPQSVAEDIKQTIGYQVDPNYTDFLARSYDELAETLIQ